ncbi:MAG: tetratricopeptide repeat protein [Sphingomonas sp.]|uniref:tetratricopeptide repeat protein n=1 Tax=Sphingomonas sp. TaxID=28214 RepID=UPI001AC3B824|nr:tetratricopeptide repeat protein [Sphingomonas sp.]MBN8807491.1 tetratricopeptide repeat protein [Sphingomonas sp.]
MAGDRTIPTCSRLALSAATLALAVASLPAVAQIERFAAYVRARAAEARGEVGAAASDYARVLAATPDDPAIAARTWREAMAAGDLALARRAATTALDTSRPGNGAIAAEVSLLRVADAIHGGDTAALARALAAMKDGPLDFLTPVIAAWGSLGNAVDPAGTLVATKQTGAFARVVRENRALLLIATNRFDVAVPDLQALLADSSGELDLRYAAAELLAGQGKSDIAMKLVAGNDVEVAGFRAAIPVAKPSAAFGVSRLFTRVAADLDDARTAPLAVALTRSALLLDPSDDRARLVLARALGRMKAYRRALAVLGEVAPTSAFRGPAAQLHIGLLRASGDDAGSLAAAKALAEAPGASATAAQVYADLLADNGHPREAIAAYDRARDRMGKDAGWEIWLQIATANDSAGDWRQARAAFDRAVKLGGNEAVALTSYGAALVARGEDLPRAVAMLERANTLTPDKPEISGALAWAYLRQGDGARALPLLETASRQAPADSSIAEHLGDAYWAAGRRYEARYAWRAALVVADGAAVLRIETKLRDGLAS